MNETKLSILNAARKLFSLRGLQGTSMKMLAADAGINQSLIHYHFGSKTDLWMLVYGWYSEELLRMTGDCAAFGESDDPISELIDALYNFVVAYPEYGSFVAWAAVEPDIEFPRPAVDNWDAMLRGVKTAQKRGVVRADVLPQTVRTIVAASVFDGFRLQGNLKNPASSADHNRFIADLKKTLGAAFCNV